MKKELRNSIIAGFFAAIGGTIVISLIQGKVAWVFLFTSLIFSLILRLYSNKRREAKEEEQESAEGVR